MDVARLHGPGDMRIAREPDPVPDAGEVLIRVTSVGLCGSDLHWFEDGRVGTTELAVPLVLGHEACGVVLTGPQAGTRVALDPAAPCGACATCRDRLEWLCPQGRFAGHAPVDGALQEFMAWPADLLVALPDSIRDPDAALLEPLGVALHAVDLSGIVTGMRAAVLGCGPIGLLIVRALQAAGVTDLIAHDPLAHRMVAAENSGGIPFDPSTIAGLPGVDVAFEASGDGDALAAAIRVTRPGGRVVLVGIPADDQTTLPASAVRRKELTFVVCRRMTPTDLTRAVGLVNSNHVSLDGLVTDVFELRDAPAAFAALARRRGLKVVVRPAGRT